MASFQGKVSWKTLRKRENQNYCSFRSNHIRNAKFQNTIMASCQGNIGWKSKRKRENKYYRFVPFLPDT